MPFEAEKCMGLLFYECVSTAVFSVEIEKRRRFKNFQDFFQEISKKKQGMFNQLTNECSIIHLDFFTQLLSWHPHYVLCLLRQRNAWDTYSLVCIYMSFQRWDRKAKTFQEFSEFFSRNFEEKARNVQSTREWVFNHPSRSLHPTPFVATTLCAMRFEAEKCMGLLFDECVSTWIFS